MFGCFRNGGDVHLNGLAEVVTSALGLDDLLVDLAGGNIVVAGQGREQVALVVAQIEIHLDITRSKVSPVFPYNSCGIPVSLSPLHHRLLRRPRRA